MLSESEEANEAFRMESEVLENLARSCSQISREHGFHDISYNQWEADIMVKLALIHTEVSEAVEVFRKRSDKASLTAEEASRLSEELADVVIRTFDLAGHRHLNLGPAILRKMEKNRYRPHLHGKSF